MKLYYSPSACSQAVHICLREIGVPFELDRVDFATSTTAAGEDYRGVNAKGYVPALRLDDGQVLTELSAILLYLADRHPEARLAPPEGTMERYRLIEWLSFIGTELHKTLGPLFNPQLLAECRAPAVARFRMRADWLATQLADRQTAMPQGFSVADAYLFVVLGWCQHFGIDLADWPAIRDYRARIGERPSVRAALSLEHPAG